MHLPYSLRQPPSATLRSDPALGWPTSTSEHAGRAMVANEGVLLCPVPRQSEQLA